MLQCLYPALSCLCFYGINAVTLVKGLWVSDRSRMQVDMMLSNDSSDRRSAASHHGGVSSRNLPCLTRPGVAALLLHV
eukprot:1821847-Rhodomonas_salina.2